MTLLLQLAAGPWLPRIPDGHVLLVFKCEGDDGCSFWEPDDVANRTLLLSAGEISGDDAVPPPAAPNASPVLPRLWVAGWERSDDRLTAEQAAAIDDPDRFWDLPEEIQSGHDFDSARLTKAGGAPYWTGNGPSAEPEGERALLFQIDNWVTAQEPGGALAAHVASEQAHRPGESYAQVHESSLTAANFMSDGIAFLFDVTPGAEIPTPRLVINR
ncbi:hypothetical protein ACFSWE_06770 [Leucobacter albus]|uniref:Immunity protein 21 of polymorphic toxin system n=1 Tax=Leucobacter albus TaxID=272210 RepID=A0ABW3TMB5_9MICO